MPQRVLGDDAHAVCARVHPLGERESAEGVDLHRLTVDGHHRVGGVLHVTVHLERVAFDEAAGDGLVDDHLGGAAVDVDVDDVGEALGGRFDAGRPVLEEESRMKLTTGDGDGLAVHDHRTDLLVAHDPLNAHGVGA